MGFGPAELVIILILLFTMVLPIWGIIDAAIRPKLVSATTRPYP